ncbi:pilus assembly protein TadE [Janibacter terrae]|uniref:pilus assembly protein TadE n=1 Tax=Janibacter terrae TaxID=103817 RepID=UPI00082CDCCC|nr:pilus assembly protein TadE [Janibacter terrae]MBA4086107.1 pilus assembly protein TadE [Kytococcus sp.]
MRARARLADDGGTAVIEFVWLAILLLVPLIYLVLCLARLQAGSYAVTQAAREAGRAFVTASDESSAQARSQAAADIAFEDQGFGEGSRLTLECTASPCLSPGESVTTRAVTSVPMPLVPGFLRDVVPLDIPVSATQVSPVPEYEAR